MSWLTRKRVGLPTTGANLRIQRGEFPIGSPATAFETNPRPSAPIFRYHEGDLFSPGAENWVFELGFELPLNTIWGFAFMRTPNTFNPIQPPQVFAPAHVVTNGLGGLQAGQMETGPLIENPMSFEGS